MNEKIKNTINQIIESFKTGDIPHAVAMACYPIPDIPSSKWSFSNRTIMFIAGTGDARGFRQWQEVGRKVKSGAKAFYIMVPFYKKEIDDVTGNEIQILKTFRYAPVFKYEDTDGEPIDHQEIDVSELPLIEKARQWGISVRAIAGQFRFHGFYNHTDKQIVLSCPEEKVFFHELSHASHAMIKGPLKNAQDPIQEIVAELSAQALCRLVGKQDKDTTGYSYRYIEKYAADLKMSVHAACLHVLCETEKVLTNILSNYSA